MLGREGKHFASLIKLWDNLLHKNVLLGGRFKREGTDVYRWLIHVNIWQKPAQHLKQLSSNWKIRKFKKECFAKAESLFSKDSWKQRLKLKQKLVKSIFRGSQTFSEVEEFWNLSRLWILDAKILLENTDYWWS